MLVLAIVRGCSGMFFTRQMNVNANTIDEAEAKVKAYMEADPGGWNDKLLAIELPGVAMVEEVR